MIDEEFRKRLADYFTGPDLVDILDVPVDILVDLLEEYIIDAKEEIDDYIHYGR